MFVDDPPNGGNAYFYSPVLFKLEFGFVQVACWAVPKILDQILLHLHSQLAWVDVMLSIGNTAGLFVPLDPVIDSALTFRVNHGNLRYG